MAMTKHGVKELYQRAKVLEARLGGTDNLDADKSFNTVLCLLAKAAEAPIVIGERLGINEREIRNRITLDEVGIAHCDPVDFRFTADYIEETLHGQVNAQNLTAAPLLRVGHLLRAMAENYEQSTAAQQRRQNEREADDRRGN